MMACKPLVSRSPALPGDDRGVGAFHFEQGIITGHARKRIGRERPADVGAFARPADAGREAHDHVGRPPTPPAIG